MYGYQCQDAPENILP